ncbi:hypothetical protein PR048_031692 [Dryococelus australis]|uniref:Helitron helicase-like domain-containing protein n=1 Tax=Dryococelus australis TaxID=614101 RepID=A0ABQ9G702_9NEOP|nr:hypothetical protein PR048_031692 [Dryococelus australis]
MHLLVIVTDETASKSAHFAVNGRYNFLECTSFAGVDGESNAAPPCPIRVQWGTDLKTQQAEQWCPHFASILGDAALITSLHSVAFLVNTERIRVIVRVSPIARKQHDRRHHSQLSIFRVEATDLELQARRNYSGTGIFKAPTSQELFRAAKAREFETGTHSRRLFAPSVSLREEGRKVRANWRTWNIQQGDEREDGTLPTRTYDQRADRRGLSVLRQKTERELSFSFVIISIKDDEKSLTGDHVKNQRTCVSEHKLALVDEALKHMLKGWTVSAWLNVIPKAAVCIGVKDGTWTSFLATLGETKAMQMHYGSAGAADVTLPLTVSNPIHGTLYRMSLTWTSFLATLGETKAMQMHYGSAGAASRNPSTHSVQPNTWDSVQDAMQMHYGSAGAASRNPSTHSVQPNTRDSVQDVAYLDVFSSYTRGNAGNANALRQCWSCRRNPSTHSVQPNTWDSVQDVAYLDVFSSYTRGNEGNANALRQCWSCKPQRLARSLSHQGDQGSIPGGVAPGFSQVGIVPDDATGRRVSPGLSRVPRPLRSAAAPYSHRLALIGSQDLDFKRRAELSVSRTIHRLLLTCVYSEDNAAASPRSRREGAIRATLTRKPSASSLLRANQDVHAHRITSNYDAFGGQVVDYWWRVEFQCRASPHLHTVAWVKDHPNIETQEGIQMIDHACVCEIPFEYSDLRELVLKCQIHRHAHTCKMNNEYSACRFNIPRKECTVTRLIASDTDDGRAGKRWRDKDHTATRGKRAIAAKRKALSWRAVLSSHCVCIRTFQYFQ